MLWQSNTTDEVHVQQYTVANHFKMFWERKNLEGEVREACRRRSSGISDKIPTKLPDNIVMPSIAQHA